MNRIIRAVYSIGERWLDGPSRKYLYHQIHPVKLLTDWGAGLAVLPLLWHHRLRPALLVCFVPGFIVSGALMRWANLEPYKQSAFGRYVKRSMTRKMEAVRLIGYLLMALGAWYRRPVLIPGGLLVILFGWFHGWLRSRLFPPQE